VQRQHQGHGIIGARISVEDDLLGSGSGGTGRYSCEYQPKEKSCKLRNAQTGAVEVFENVVFSRASDD
jgi:hypothetical protein